MQERFETFLGELERQKGAKEDQVSVCVCVCGVLQGDVLLCVVNLSVEKTAVLNFSH